MAEEIMVRGTWQHINDTDIARQAGEALARSVRVPDGSVRASVHDHIVTLSGQVPWHYQREAADYAVRYLNGVAMVNNTVTIHSTASADSIKSAITAALMRSAQSEGSHITVTAADAGAVNLDGTVHSWSERRAAEHAAWSTPGVTDVTNQLRIQS